jgi:thiol-disulfide isomerase/thioredoxin
MRRLLAILFCALIAGNAQLALRRAPSWALVDNSGQLRDLLDYRGKVLVLEMMQTSCPHCAAFADVLAQIPQRYGDKVAIVAVASIPQDNTSTVKEYVAGHKVTYPIVFDAGQMQYSYILKPHIDLPAVFIIDQNGYIRGEYQHSVTLESFFEGKGLFAELDRLTGMGRK